MVRIIISQSKHGKNRRWFHLTLLIDSKPQREQQSRGCDDDRETPMRFRRKEYQDEHSRLFYSYQRLQLNVFRPMKTNSRFLEYSKSGQATCFLLNSLSESTCVMELKDEALTTHSSEIQLWECWEELSKQTLGAGDVHYWEVDNYKNPCDYVGPGTENC